MDCISIRFCRFFVIWSHGSCRIFSIRLGGEKLLRFFIIVFFEKFGPYAFD